MLVSSEVILSVLSHLLQPETDNDNAIQWQTMAWTLFKRQRSTTIYAPTSGTENLICSISAQRSDAACMQRTFDVFKILHSLTPNWIPQPVPMESHHSLAGLGRTGPTLCTGPVFLWISTNQLGRVWFLRPLPSFPTSHRDISPQKPITAPQACGLLVYCVLLCLLITVVLISGFRHLIEDWKWISTYPGCPASSGYDAMCIELQSGEVLKAKHAIDIHVQTEALPP